MPGRGAHEINRFLETRLFTVFTAFALYTLKFILYAFIRKDFESVCVAIVQLDD